MLRECRACRACRATSRFSLPRAYLIGQPAVCCGVVLPVCPCVVSFSKVYEPDTHDLLRTSHQHPRSILVRHVQFPRTFFGDILARMSLGMRMPQRCYEKTAPVEFQLIHAHMYLMRLDRLSLITTAAACKAIDTKLIGNHSNVP